MYTRACVVCPFDTLLVGDTGLIKRLEEGAVKCFVHIHFARLLVLRVTSILSQNIINEKTSILLRSWVEGEVDAAVLHSSALRLM